MNRTLSILGLALLVAVALTIVLPAPAQAQVIVVQSPPVFAPPPVVTYSVPRVSYYPAPVVTTYSAYPATPIGTTYSAYPGPVVTSYAAPVVTYSAPVVTYSAPVVTYSAPIAAPAAGVYTTYTYWNGLGIFRPRYVNQTYYTPLR